jgi:sirohydrochlorin ferrochelatase
MGDAVTLGSALLVAHGQPSDPAQAGAELAGLAARVAVHLPGWRIGSATLAEPEALAGAVKGSAGVVYPVFMAGGWFTRVHLPARLAAAGAVGWRVLEPMGCDPDIHALAVDQIRAALAGKPGAEVVIAAHGSSRSPAPSDVARHLASRVAAELGLASVRAAFIDQSPRLADLPHLGDGAVCLPFFAAAGGHVTDDIPQALAEAGFRGRLLPALGLNPRLPTVIAAAITAGQPVCAETCRYATRA